MDTKTQNMIRKICHDHPDEVCEVLLETPFCLKKLATRTAYMRQSDDTRSHLTVSISPDGDSWIEVISDLNPHEFSTQHRFRDFFGGGQSLRVHLALRILALAILRDNEERRQPLLPFVKL
jgi:hypothetical protein